ncbi:MAG: SGNH/GDSL hydrolase family protein [Idiomarina sp.]|nr:SGNH/GDSL hydrolase family protein [Idiomarina sp.]
MQVPLLHPTLSILLLPVLMYQGQKVRKDVPRLPEAAGPREGQFSPGDSEHRPLRVLILGDSAAAGVGVDQQQEALSGQVLSHLPSELPVRWRLLAQNGLKLKDIVKLLDDHEDSYDIAIVSAGVNDATSRTRRYQFLCELQGLSERLKRRHGVQHILYTAVPPMQVFPALPQPLRWYLGQRAKRLNSILRAHCNKCEFAEMMVVDFPFTADYMASDGFHPSAEGYRLWGGRAAALIKEWRAKHK